MKTVFSHSCQDKNEKSYCISKGNGKDLMPPLRISRMQGLQVSSCVHLIYQSRQILENDYRLLNLQPGRGSHWFVKCVVFYLRQARRWEMVHFHLEWAAPHISVYVSAMLTLRPIAASKSEVRWTFWTSYWKPCWAFTSKTSFWSGKINERWLAHWSLDGHLGKHPALMNTLLASNIKVVLPTAEV